MPKSKTEGGAPEPAPVTARATELEDWTWTIGQVVAPFGLVGEVKVRYETDFPERFRSLKEVCLRDRHGRGRIYQVQRSRPHKGQELLKLYGVDHIDAAETLRGARVQVPRSEAVPLGPDSYYVTDLVGVEVFLRNGDRLGALERVLPYPAHDLYAVGDALIPAVKEFILEVDLAGRRMVVDVPEGVLPESEPAPES